MTEVNVYGDAGTFEYAPLGTTWPTNALDALDAAFIDLGVISGEEGFENKLEADAEVAARDWNGVPLAVAVPETDDSWTFTFVEDSDAVREFVRGTPVETNPDGGSMQLGGQPTTLPVVGVITTITSRGVLKRTLVPQLVIMKREPIPTSNKKATTYKVTVAGLKDDTLGAPSVSYYDDSLAS